MKTALDKKLTSAVLLNAYNLSPPPPEMFCLLYDDYYYGIKYSFINRHGDQRALKGPNES